MKQKGLVIGLVVAVLALNSVTCGVSGLGVIRGSGRVDEKVFEVGDVSGVELATFGDLVIEIGDAEELRIEAEDNLIDYFEADVYGDELEIKSAPGVNMRPTRPVKFYLTVRALDSIKVTGSGNVYAPDLEGERVTVSITGSGDVETGDLTADAANGVIELRITGSGNLDVAECQADEQRIAVTGSGDVKIEEVDVDVLDVQINGSGNVDVADGRVDEQSVRITGSGDYYARRVAGAEADVRLTGSGSATLQASEYLEARISGSGDVHYVGNPTVDQSTPGSGDVVRIGD